MAKDVGHLRCARSENGLTWVTTFQPLLSSMSCREWHTRDQIGGDSVKCEATWRGVYDAFCLARALALKRCASLVVWIFSASVGVRSAVSSASTIPFIN